MYKIAALAAAGIIGMTSFSYAAEPLIKEDVTGGQFSANVSAVSEYFFRGTSQTNDVPALQGGFDWEHSSGFSIGVWGSSVNFNDGDEASVEADVYAAYGGSIGKVSYSIGTIYYAYPGANSDLDYNFWEMNGSVGYDFDVASATVGINWSPDYFGGSGNATYLTGDVEVPIGKYVTLGLHIGRQWIEKNAVWGTPDYLDYNVSLGVNVFGFDVALTWTDTDLSKSECFGGTDNCESTVWLSVGRSF